RGEATRGRWRSAVATPPAPACGPRAARGAPGLPAAPARLRAGWPRSAPWLLVQQDADLCPAVCGLPLQRLIGRDGLGGAEAVGLEPGRPHLEVRDAV